MSKFESLLESPCIFCGYKGSGYYQLETHKGNCPWRKIGGKIEREEFFERRFNMFLDALKKNDYVDLFDGVNNSYLKLDPDLPDLWRKLYDDLITTGPVVTNEAFRFLYKKTDKELIYRVQIPGFSRDEISVSIENNKMKIAAKSEARKKYIGDIRIDGEERSCSYSISLPGDLDMDIDNVQAHLNDGVLYLIVPMKNKKIPVKTIEVK